MHKNKSPTTHQSLLRKARGAYELGMTGVFVGTSSVVSYVLDKINANLDAKLAKPDLSWYATHHNLVQDICIVGGCAGVIATVASVVLANVFLTNAQKARNNGY
jgi:hypothetical protein